jgi:hypothetical protein
MTQITSNSSSTNSPALVYYNALLSANNNNAAAVNEQLINNPLSFIDSLINQQNVNLSAGNNWGVSELYKQIISNSDNLSIPLLNTVRSDLCVPNRIVHVRGVVSSTSESSSYYRGILTQSNEKKEQQFVTHKYRDEISSKQGWTVDHADENNLQANNSIYERSSVNLVTVPHENDWFRSTEQQLNTNNGPNSSNATPPKAKRPLDYSDCTEETKQMTDDNGSNAEAVDSNDKRYKQEGSDTNLSSSSAVSSVQKNFSSSSGSLEVLIDLYDDQQNSLRIGDVVEIYGILSVTPIAAMDNESMDEKSEAFNELNSPAQPNRALKLHCLYSSPVSSLYPLHALYNRLNSNSRLTAAEFRANLLARAKGIRSSMQQFLAQTIFHDELASELYLLSLISRISARDSANSKLIGKFSVNYMFPRSAESKEIKTIAEKLAHFDRNVCRASTKLELNLEFLNNVRLARVKDYESNELLGSPLFLANSTHLIVDESSLSSGNLNETGLANVATLEKFVQHSALDYDFHYGQMLSLAVDVPTVLLSYNESLLKSAAEIKLKLQPGAQKATENHENFSLNDTEVLAWRSYLAVSQELEYSISSEVGGAIQNYFVALRSANPKNPLINGEFLDNCLLLARLISVSYGESGLSSENFHSAVQLLVAVHSRNGHAAINDFTPVNI